ncbi:MAG: hypothetical protein JST00_40110 [Deltaproteobacteria bacterium]|nr:hypothetical protein [Deltaproteobacteria bacterium]
MVNVVAASASRVFLRLGGRLLDPVLYALWAAACTLGSARMFYGYMLKQTGGEWSAPLDDVFIHFDYARATALGHPFEWTVGNGYSSGNTSLTYPFVLAAGWLVGFTGRSLMIWAAIVASVSVFGVLLAARRLFIDAERDVWGRVASYLLPPIFLGVGALDWSLWSGMEVSFFLATWAIALVAFLELEQRVRRGGRTRLPALWLGLTGALMVTTRPEAASTIAIFGIAVASRQLRASGMRRALATLVLVGTPAALCLAAQSIANKALTGEWSANGAIVKLALNNPYMTGAEKYEDWIGNARYAVTRNLDYHFAHIEGDHMSELVKSLAPTNPVSSALVYLARTAWWAGVIPLALGTLPLVFPRTRRIGILIWAQIVTWVLIVALNGQVRWQNERYVMPAVAWLLVLAALGVAACFRRHGRVVVGFFGRGRTQRPTALVTLVVGALLVQVVGVLTRPAGTPPTFRLSWVLAFGAAGVFYVLLRPWASRAVLVVLALLFAWDHQLPKMRDQKWFFGRASRNIRDQHLTLGKYLGELKPQRVLVGDAGAILYESDRPGLDIIGLGGYRALPFARAGVHGLPATLELIERIPDKERPDLLAIFPTWFGQLPVWFSSEILRRFPVEGNVICGGYEAIVYRADWHVLGTGQQIRFMPKGTRKLRAEIDVGDLVSEQRNEYTFSRPGNGFTEMKILPDPADTRVDMFDAGRRIAVGARESFVVRSLSTNTSYHLVVRTAPEKKTTVRVLVNGRANGALEIEGNGWIEPSIAIDPANIGTDSRIELVNEGPGDFVDYHAWLTQ